jgi:MFS family permease
MGSAYLLLTGSIIIALSLFMTCYLGEMWLVFFSSCLSGIGLCWSDTSYTTQTLLFEKKTNKNRMGWLRFINAIGQIVGGLVIGAVVQYKVDLCSFGIGFMIFFITISIVPFSWLIQWNEETEIVGTVKCIDDSPISIISYKPLIPISIINFLLSVINSSIADWGVLYYSIVLQSSPFVSTIGFTIYKFVVAFGRFLVDYLGKIYSTRIIILTSAFFSAIGLTILVVSPFAQNDILKVIIATFGLSISALGICTIRPTVMSEIKNYNINIPPVKSNTFITYFSQAGMIISKPMMAGIAAGTNDLRYVFGLNAVLSLFLFVFIFVIFQEQLPEDELP